METGENIIAIRNHDIDAANAAFADFMRKTEDCFNQKSKQDPCLYKDVSPGELEKITERMLKDIAPSTPFNPTEIHLISGHRFPDIVAEQYYGVEVKSTKDNKWTSTGSSIVETTRIDTIDNIYMLFGKLGGTPPEFRCRPYQECLYDIAVTHSPRYLIDMNLQIGETIFDKLDFSYDELRNSPKAIEHVKQYYKEQAIIQGNQMPWWIDDTETEPIAMNIRLWNSLTVLERNKLKAQMLILFPEIVNSEYGNAAMWLASAKGVVNPSFRDIISAGGRIYNLNGESIEDGIPKVWKTLALNYPLIKEYLQNSKVIYPYIKEYNPNIISKNMLDKWIEQVERLLPQVVIGNKRLSFHNLMDFLREI